QQSADIAAEIQRTITPKKLPQFPTLSLGSYSSPALGVSGDYFDVMQTRKDRLVCVVGDVAGKGVSAALIMVMIRSILHLITNTDRDIATVLDWVNRGITGQVDMDHYATLCIVAINMETGVMEYANANHQPIMVYRRAKNEVELVELKSVPIGVERGSTYQRLSLKLEDGDLVALYTDGVVEALNESGKQYGRKSLSQAMIKYKDLAPKEIANKIKNDLEVFAGSVRQHDDQTVLVLKIKR
ncbi:MAG TPA: PP2C family protein-serine/threonine phosphatase, partial [Spirochaetales bacterium]|nr:PP2C family protein-serine/threonine phosphatase [Spirochaetales bacterium]